MEQKKVFEITEGNEGTAISRLKMAANQSEEFHLDRLLDMEGSHPVLHRFVVRTAMESGSIHDCGFGAAIAYDLMTMQLESEGKTLDVTQEDAQRHRMVILKNTPGLIDFNVLLQENPEGALNLHRLRMDPQTRYEWLWDRLEAGEHSRYLGFIFSFSSQYEDRFGKPKSRKLLQGMIGVTGLVVTVLDPTLGHSE